MLSILLAKKVLSAMIQVWGAQDARSVFESVYSSRSSNRAVDLTVLDDTDGCAEIDGGR